MTRRVLVFKENNLFHVSQEFNGDKREIQKLWNSQDVPLKADWEEIPSLFNNIKSLKEFKKVVKNVEDLYTYENYPLETETELPKQQEVWMVIDGELKLYSEYGEIV